MASLLEVQWTDLLPRLLDAPYPYHGLLSRTALCCVIGGLYILTPSHASTTSTAVKTVSRGDTVCFLMIAAALLWLLTTPEGRELVLQRLVWCVPGVWPAGTVIPLVTLWTTVLAILDARLTTKAAPPPPRSLSFITPLRGLACLWVLLYHMVISFLVLAALPADAYAVHAHRFPYPADWLRHPAVLLLWGGGHLAVRVFSLITGRVLLVRYMRDRSIEGLMQSMAQRYCRLFVGVLVSVAGYVALTRLGAQASVDRAHEIANCNGLYFSVSSQPMETLTMRQCFNIVARVMSLDLSQPFPDDAGHLWSIPGTIRVSMCTLALAPLFLTLRLPVRLALYAAVYLSTSPTKYYWLEPFLLGLALADLDESTTALRRMPHSRSRSVHLGLWALRAYLLVIWATGQARFYGTGILGPDQRKVEGAFCLFLLLHLTPPACSALEWCRPIHELGRLSFGVYLWHGMCISSVGTALLVHLHESGLGFLPCMACVFVAVVTASVLASYVFHIQVERPVDRATRLLCQEVTADPRHKAEGAQ